jgi:L-threonylcarbamoyladenylate synthase
MIDSEILKKAVNILQKGGLVAIPTETVYGLAADAKNPEALKKIFQAKGRPIDHPLIVHIADINQLSDWAMDISDEAYTLAKTFWPGPLTLILKKAPAVNAIVTGGQNTVGVRIPNHPIALALLTALGRGVAAPSANRFGKISPTTAKAVREELDARVDLILEGGQCEVGVESTIVDMSGEDIRILRPGMITAQQIEEVLHQHLSQQKKNAPRVSGSLDSHYAPRTVLRIMSRQEIITFLSENSAQIGILVREKILSLPVSVTCVVMPVTSKDYAHDLYLTLRELDKKNLALLIVEALPEENEWDAVRDRLQRAAGAKPFSPLKKGDKGGFL